MPTSCKSELNIHITSLEIRGGFKFRINWLPLSSYSSTLCISPINTCNLKGKRGRTKQRVELRLIYSLYFRFLFSFM